MGDASRAVNEVGTAAATLASLRMGLAEGLHAVYVIVAALATLGFVVALFFESR